MLSTMVRKLWGLIRGDSYSELFYIFLHCDVTRVMIMQKNIEQKRRALQRGTDSTEYQMHEFDEAFSFP